MPRSLTPRSPSPPSAFWPLFQATHHLLHPGARPPGFFPPTFSRRSGLFHDSHLVRLGKAAAWPRGRGCSVRRAAGETGGGTRSAPRRCHSGKHPTFQPSPEHPPRWPGWQIHRVGRAVGAQPMGKTPGGTVSSSSAAVARATMAMAVPATSYSCRLLLKTGEGHRRHPKGFPPAFLGKFGDRGWLVGSAHLHFHPPAAASHDAGDDQQREPCGKRRGRR